MKFTLLKTNNSEIGIRLDQFLAKKLSMTRENIKKNIDADQIFCFKYENKNDSLSEENENTEEMDDSEKILETFQNNNIKKKAVKLSHKISENDCIAFKLYEEENEKEKKDLSGFDFQKMIVFEDEHLIIINKEWNILTHDKPGDSNEVTIVDLMKDHLEKQNLDFNVGEEGRECIVHRLDKETSGLMILAKTQKSYQLLTKMFKDKEISKKYLGIICGKLNPMCGKIKEYIGRDKINRMKRCVAIKKTLKHYPDAKEAITHFFMKEEYIGGRVSLAEFILETGRTHQIRVHMDFLKCPILGDKMYGMNRNNDIQRNYLNTEIKRHMLHSHYLQFEHPITQEIIELESRLPDDMKKVIHICKTINLK